MNKNIRKRSKSTSAKAKDRIQDLLRKKAIKRDGGCVLRNHQGMSGHCGPEKSDGTLILQAEHLNGRANSVSYADMDNIVCLCLNHHIFFKKRNPGLYYILIKEIVGEERWGKIQDWMKDKTSHRVTASEWLAKEEELKSV